MNRTCDDFPVQVAYKSHQIAPSDDYIEVEADHNSHLIGVSPRLKRAIETVEAINPIKMSQDIVDNRKTLLLLQEVFAELEDVVNMIINRREYEYYIERDQIFPSQENDNELTFNLPVEVHNVSINELSEQIDVFLNGVRIEDLSTNKHFTLEHTTGEPTIKIIISQEIFDPTEDEVYIIVPYIKRRKGEPYNYDEN